MSRRWRTGRPVGAKYPVVVTASAPARLYFRPRHRLAHERQFGAVYGARVRKHSGPLTVFALPNGLAHARLGLGVGRRVGNAVERGAVKRRLREAFRLHQMELAPEGVGYDYCIVVAKHEMESPERYAERLVGCARALHKEWAKRAEKGS